MAALKVLHVAAEMTPLVKVGGLADVVGALSKANARAGMETRVIIPHYGAIVLPKAELRSGGPWPVRLSWQEREAVRQSYQLTAQGPTVELLGDEEAFGGSSVYWNDKDNTGRYLLLCRAVIDYCHQQEWYPDVIHCHDWMTGLVPVYLNTTEAGGPLHGSATVFTIHNLQHQGDAPLSRLAEAGLPESLYGPGGIDHRGKLNFLKAGLYHATKLTTVSPSYAREIQTPAYGCGLEEVLCQRSADLSGILNGIDTEEWNPATDKLLPARYTPTQLKGKATCKAALQERLGLEIDPDIAVFGVVARLFEQKGLDLLSVIMERLMNHHHLQIALLGSGDPSLEAAFRSHSERFAGRVGCYMGYNAGLSHLVEAGSDFFLMPSRFEPCGLNQMYSLAYGTLPIVRATGGLIDSVSPLNEGLPGGTGIRFNEATPAALEEAIGEACALFYDHPRRYRNAQQRAMNLSLGWDDAAERYHELYHEAVRTRRVGLGLEPG